MFFERRIYWIKWGGLFSIMILLLVSCGSNLADDNQEITLCGISGDNVTRVYHVSVSQAGAIILKQVIELPGGDMTRNGSCPQWLANHRFAWLYGKMADGYQRDVYWLDLDRGQVKKWFHLNGDDDIADVILLSDSPAALLISSRGQSEGCSQYSDWEHHMNCVRARGDLYTVNDQGEVSRLTIDQSPLCEATWNPSGHTVAFRRATGCLRPAPFENSEILLVDTQTKRVRSFINNQGRTPLWSPDGQLLAFTRLAQRPGESLDGLLYVLDIDDDRGISENDSKGWDKSVPVWSPDSQWLAWMTFRITATSEYSWVSVFDPIRQTRIEFPTQENAAPSRLQWSPDGKTLVWKIGSTFNLGDVESSKIHNVPVEVEISDWSFNGKLVAYIGFTNPRGPNAVFVVRSDGKGIVNVTDELSLKDIQWLQVNWVK